MKRRTTTLARGIALAFAVPASWLVPAAPSLAQATAAPEAETLETVVVTARRKTENLQQVPTAVTTLNEHDLKDLNVTGFDQVGQTVPNLNVQRQFGSTAAPVFSMRGQDSGSVAFQVDNRIGLYVDGVYLGRSGSSAFALANLCRMEALRGPQGTLFGRNATGGAVNLVTCAPSDAFGGSVELGIGNFRERHARAELDLPVGNGLAARVTALHTQHDGYVTNSRPGVATQLNEPFGTVVSADDFGRDRTNAVGAAVTYTGVKNLKLDYRFDHTESKSTQLAAQLLALNGPIGGLYDPTIGTGGNTPSLERQGSVPEEFTGTGRLRVSGHALTAEYKLGDELTVKNILSYRTLSENTSGNDIDGASFNGNFLTFAGVPTPATQQVCYICSIGVRDQHQISNELQLLGASGPLDWIAGLFYFREAGRSDGPVFIGGSFTPGVVNTVGSLSRFVPSDYFAGSLAEVENKSTALYGHVNYKVTSALTVSAGLRHTRDDRREDLLLSPNPSPVSGTAAFSYNDWNLAANYALTPDVNGYVKAGTAHLSGGIQGGSPFAPEANRALEVGVKSELLDKRMRLNVALFDNRVSHQQLAQFSTSTGFTTIDGGKARQRGFEAEMTFKPTGNLTLNANYGYVRATSELGFAPLTPKQTLYLGAEYKLQPWANGVRPSVRVDASWRDKAASGPCQTGQATTSTGCSGAGDPVLTEAIALKARTSLGARVSLAEIPLGGSTTGRLSLWGRNLLDSRKLQFARDLGNGIVIGSFEEPRTYGVELSVAF